MAQAKASTDTARPQARVPDAWVLFLHAHAAITRQMDADLIAAHGLTLSAYEVLFRLAQAPDFRMRRVDLAEGVLLTQSGITRLLARLEDAGLVERASCETDRRVVYAQLTEAGHAKYHEAGPTHLEGIHVLFAHHFSEDELETLRALIGRLPQGPEDTACTLDAAPEIA